MSKRAVIVSLISAGALSASPAAADTLPMDHSAVPARFRIVNVAELDDWLIVAYPCTPELYYERAGELGLGLDPYCVIRSADLHQVSGQLFALSSKDAKVIDPLATLPDPPVNRDALKLPPLRIDIIDVTTIEKFFASDRRVKRLDFALPGDTVVVHDSQGIASIQYDIAIEPAGETLRASYRRSAFACKHGPTIELPPSATAPEPPSCFVEGDRGDLVPGPSAGSDEPWLHPTALPAPPAPVLRVGLVALGAAFVSLGLLGVGLLWRRQRPAEAKPHPEAVRVDGKRPGKGGT